MRSPTDTCDLERRFDGLYTFLLEGGGLCARQKSSPYKLIRKMAINHRQELWHQLYSGRLALATANVSLENFHRGRLNAAIRNLANIVNTVPA